jgi:hypothetical protein
MGKVGKLVLGNPYFVLLYVVLTGSYALATLLPSPDPAVTAKYHLSTAQLRLLLFTIVFPYIVIWTISFVAYLRFRSYSMAINSGKDGEAWREVTKGILWIILSLPVYSSINALSAILYRNNPAWTANLVRFDIYVSLIVMALGLIYIYRGSTQLLSVVHKYQFHTSLKLVLAYVAFAGVYTFMTFHDATRTLPDDHVMRATYYEPDWLILFTIVIPRLLMWFVGLQALYNITLYFQKVRGKLYKSALINLTQGIAAVLAATMLLRVLQTLNSVLARFGVGMVLMIIYLLLIGLGIGYFLLDKGARKLEALENA